MKRLIVYFHYDPLGQIDTACRLAVEAMARYGEVFFISNGTLRPADRAWAAAVTLACRERENTGLDLGAYQEALAEIGRERLANYDELVLMNFTLAGPVCSLAPMFTAMEARPELAFWGLTRHYAMKSRRFGGRSGEVPEHLQSHFLAVRAPLLGSDDFWRYWQEMPLPKSYEESIANHETRFTTHFANLGCCWDSYVNTQDLKEAFVNPIMACPRELLANRGCPFFKRRSFFTPCADELRRTDGTAARALYDYIKQTTDYPVDLLLAALLQRQPLDALAGELHWQYVLPDAAPAEAPDLDAMGLALLHLPMPESDPVTAWYNREAARMADEAISQAAALFAREPMLGVVSPAVPLWPAAQLSRNADWQAARPALQGKVRVPLGQDPPPAPACGWALVRLAAVADGDTLPAITTPADAWLLPLKAQQNGFISASFTTAAGAAAAADQLALYYRQAADPGAVAKQLGRLVKHKFKQ